MTLSNGVKFQTDLSLKPITGRNFLLRLKAEDAKFIFVNISFFLLSKEGRSVLLSSSVIDAINFCQFVSFRRHLVPR